MNIFQNLIRLINDHPDKAAKVAASAFTLACPGCVVVPMICAASFTVGGAIAGLAATVADSPHEQIAAHGVFAMMQSAAAGGYGVAIVNGAVQAVSAVGNAWSWIRGT